MQSAETSTPELERKEILKQYRNLLKSLRQQMNKDDKKMIRQAFEMALEAHKETRRKSGEPYILHPLAVAQIVSSEIGLGPTAVACALLHDVVEDTETTLEDIERDFGKKAAEIVDGLTKIDVVFDVKGYLQAENIRKILLTLAKDVRVILIKIADRLHNMRTLDAMSRNKQLKIASETQYLYVPLAHRLGLYAIKLELEDLIMKYNEPRIYQEIMEKLAESKRERNRYINEFIRPLQEELAHQKIKAKIFGRPKSLHSIWRKMKEKDVPFEEVYDKFAVRIIVDAPEELEKSECWRVYSLVTDSYRPNPDRLRDWISTPKSNGYEALHTTVMGPKGKWVEVQIRSKRMDEIAEKGYAAHYKYKENETTDSTLDEWIRKIRELLDNPDTNTLDFIDDFKLNLFADEIYVFTPNGDLKILPSNATVLDFAYEIHSDIGSHCIGGKLNHKIVPLSNVLNNGDQVEILTSKRQRPSEDWLGFVVTAKAKSKIKEVLKIERKQIIDKGRQLFDKEWEILKDHRATPMFNKILEHYNIASVNDLYYTIGINELKAEDVIQIAIQKEVKKKESFDKLDNSQMEQAIKSKLMQNANVMVFGEDSDQIDYNLAECCKPIPGDEVFGYINKNNEIEVHRSNCPKAINVISKYGYRIVKTKWTKQHQIAFLTGLKITGLDDVGVMFKITNVISGELKLNMQSITIDTKDGVFEGIIKVFVNDTSHLNNLMAKLRSLDGILSLTRLEEQTEQITN